MGGKDSEAQTHLSFGVEDIKDEDGNSIEYTSLGSDLIEALKLKRTLEKNDWSFLQDVSNLEK